MQTKISPQVQRTKTAPFPAIMVRHYSPQGACDRNNFAYIQYMGAVWSIFLQRQMAVSFYASSVASSAVGTAATSDLRGRRVARLLVDLLFTIGANMSDGSVMVTVR
jgi:hypothetical protein